MEYSTMTIKKNRNWKSGTSNHGTATRRFKSYKVRNKLEKKVLETLRENCPAFEGYETAKLIYTIPSSTHTYTPDFKVGTTYYETKGLWDTQDRQKMLYVIEQHPDKTFVMVFYNPYYKIYKNSKTTYAAWCDKKGIRWTTAKLLQKELTNG
jgi:hypothetical protein